MFVKPPSIKDIGLKQYLDDTADKHNGFDYATFVKLAAHEGVTTLARTYAVSRLTMYKWQKIYHEEQAIAK